MGLAHKLDQPLKRYCRVTVSPGSRRFHQLSRLIPIVCRQTADCFRQGSDGVIAHFEPVSLLSRVIVNERKLCFTVSFWIVTEAIAACAYWNDELQPFLVVIKVVQRAEMWCKSICSDEYLEWQIWYNTKFMPQQIRSD